jgi:hypothetical protein
MLEMLVSLLAIIVTPSIIETLEFPVPLYGGIIVSNLYYIIAIIFITLIANIVRSFRYCKKKGSYGINSGLKKGVLSGIITILISTIINAIPVLKAPLLALSFIPVIGSMINGLALMIGYLIGYPISMFFGDC